MPEKVYEVIKAVTQKVDVKIDDKQMPFGKLGAFRVKDPGKAEAIRQKYGRKVTVTGINPTPVMERKLHPNRIVSPGMPWHKYNELGKIIRDNPKETPNALQDRESSASNQTQENNHEEIN